MAAQKRAPETTATNPATPAREFRRLVESGSKAGASRAIGRAFSIARDAVARTLIRLGATPNRITFLGFLMTAAAGFCLARGAAQQVPYFYTGSGPVGWWPFIAGLLLILAGACDMLDGAIARVGNMSSKFGAILDSTLDRFSDMALYLGCLWHFALREEPIYQLLAAFALCNTFLISYVKARAEEIIDDCSVGWWARGERCVALLIGCFTGHMPFVLWQQATLPLFTVLRRIAFSYQSVIALERGTPPPPHGPVPGWRGKLQLWRYPRGSVQFDVVVAFNIGCIIFVGWIWPAWFTIQD